MMWFARSSVKVAARQGLPSRVGMSGVKDLRLLQRMAAGLPTFNEGR